MAKKGKNKPYFLAKKKESPTKSLDQLVKGQIYWVTGFFYDKDADKFEIVEPFGAVYPSHCQGEFKLEKMILAHSDVGDITNYLGIQLLRGLAPRKVSIFPDRVDAIRFVNGLEAWLRKNERVRDKLRSSSGVVHYE